MKKLLFILILMLSSSVYFNINAQSNSKENLKTIKVATTAGEKIFIENADQCLATMVQKAEEISVGGVALVAYVPGDVTKSWISMMKVVGAMSNENANLLAIVYSKAAEMADTYKNSGSKVREPKQGEFGWQGGVLKKVDSGYIIVAFSGATGEQDVEISKKGLECLSKQY
jgi:hypothetical protein